MLQVHLQDKDNLLEVVIKNITKMGHKLQDYKTYNTINLMMKRIEDMSEKAKLI